MFIFILFFFQKALTFNLTITDEKVTIFTETKYVINISVTSEIDDRILLRQKGITSWMVIEEFGSIKAGETKSIRFIIEPRYDTIPGTYKVNIELESLNTGEKKEITIFITVLRSINARIDSVDVSGLLVPNGSAKIRITLSNPGANHISNILVKCDIKSTYQQVIGYFFEIIDLASGETKIIEKTIDIPINAEPGNYIGSIELYFNGKLINRKDFDFKVSASPIVQKYIFRKPLLFGNYYEIKVENIGNAEAKNLTIVEEIPFLNILSYKQISGPKPRIEKNKIYWNIDKLSPNENIVIEFETNYSHIIILLFVFVGIFLFYLHKLTGVVIKKVLVRRGENSEITIAIEIKNNTGREIRKVEVKDYVPFIFKLRHVEGPKPIYKVQEKHTEIKWKFGSMKPNEEVVVSYRIKPLLIVKGGISLPSAEVRYEIGKKIISKKSSALSI
jgi:hypothetical protein